MVKYCENIYVNNNRILNISVIVELVMRVKCLYKIVYSILFYNKQYFRKFNRKFRASVSVYSIDVLICIMIRVSTAVRAMCPHSFV